SNTTTSGTSTLVYMVSESTEIIFSTAAPRAQTLATANEFAGYESQTKLLRTLLSGPGMGSGSSHGEALPRTILVTGPSGTGKTLAIRCLFDEISARVNLVTIHCSLFLSKSFEFDRLQAAFRNLALLKP